MIEITTHAFERARERLGLKKNSFEKFVLKAVQHGIHNHECKGLLKKYIDELIDEDNKSIVIYGEAMLFFSDNILVTTYLLPSEYKKYLKIC